jgi:hypothetical protein
MANTYDAQMKQAESPAAPEDDPSTQGKASKAEVNYVMGNPQRSCGLCGNFQSKEHKCDVTDEAGDPTPGEISPFGFCDTYLRQDNPFIAGTQSTFDEGSEEETSAEDTAPAEEPEQPGLQIGNRRYA